MQKIARMILTIAKRSISGIQFLISHTGKFPFWIAEILQGPVASMIGDEFEQFIYERINTGPSTTLLYAHTSIHYNANATDSDIQRERE